MVTPRGEGALRRHRLSAVGNTWPGCGPIPEVVPPVEAHVLHFSPPHMRTALYTSHSPSSHPRCDVPQFPRRRTSKNRQGMVSARGVRRSVWDPEISRKRSGDWGRRSGPSCLLPQRRATRPNGEWGLCFQESLFQHRYDFKRLKKTHSPYACPT